MEITKSFSIADQRNRRTKRVIWMRKKNITQSFVFSKWEADERLEGLKKIGWVEIPAPKSSFG